MKLIIHNMITYVDIMKQEINMYIYMRLCVCIEFCW